MRVQRILGFTIIELMLAAGVAAVLMMIAFASYDRYIERTRVFKAVSYIAALQMDIKAYELNNNALPDDLSAINRAGDLDPWKRPYVYTNLSNTKGKGAARKDHKLNPINSDYDLYSLGKDGMTKPQISHKLSLDDVVRASDGKFIGLAKDF
jgi:general secretion pathway protein G